MSFFGQNAVTSTNNSTTTPLSGSATYTGTGELNGRSQVLVYCIADTAGTLYLQWSNDNVTYYDFPVNGIPVSANIPKYYPAVKGNRYCRVKYINGTSAQSSFNLSTYYTDESVPSVSPLNQAINLTDPSLIVRPTLPWLDTARGLLSGVEPILKFGRNTAVGTSFVPLTLGGVYRTPQSGSATTVRIKSGGNANDTAAGSGAREVTIEGLDENFAAASEVIATAGTSASSSTTTTFTRIYRAYVSKSGTYATASAGSHSGDIVIENTAGTEDWLTIDSSDFPKSQSEVGAYSVPAGKTAYVFLKNITLDTSKTSDIVFFTRENIDETSAPYSSMRAKSVLVGLESNSYLTNVDVPYVVTGPADFGFLGKVSSTTSPLAVEFEMFVIDE